MSEKIRLQNLISESQEEEVVEIVRNALQEYMLVGETEKQQVEEAYNQFIVLSSSCKNTFNQFRLKTIDSKDFAVLKAQLNQSLVMFVNQLPIQFYQYFDNRREQVKKNASFQEEAYQILHLSKENITVEQLVKQYHKLQAEYQSGLENAPNRLKSHFESELSVLKNAFDLIYVQLKTVEDKYLNECYVVLESEQGISFNALKNNYLALKNNYENLLKSENVSIQNLAKTEIEHLDSSFLYVIFCDYMVLVEGEKPFYMDRFPVTVALYQYYCKKIGRQMPKSPAWGWIPTHPITNINWYEAQEFAVYFGKRIPTEMEWERAASGGDLSQQFVFSGSNEVQDVAWVKDNSNQQTQSVGLKNANELGIFDMSGNVWEWCQDAYANTQQYKILKGGSWKNLKESAAITRRDNEDMDAQNSINGFRCVKSLLKDTIF